MLPSPNSHFIRSDTGWKELPQVGGATVFLERPLFAREEDSQILA